MRPSSTTPAGRDPRRDSEQAGVARRGARRDSFAVHTLIGERIIAAAPALRRVATLVRSCHENFDGTGYPDRLSGEEIPLGSRIIAVCDAVVAMTADRPYGKAMNEQEALAELRRCAGTQFDPVVVQRACEAFGADRSPMVRVA